MYNFTCNCRVIYNGVAHAAGETFPISNRDVDALRQYGTFEAIPSENLMLAGIADGSAAKPKKHTAKKK